MLEKYFTNAFADREVKRMRRSEREHYIHNRPSPGKTLLDYTRGCFSTMSDRPDKAAALQLLKRTRSFVCTDEFTATVAKVSMTTGEKMLELAHHARPPHTPMMIEWNVPVRRAALTAAGSAVKPPVDGIPEPRKAGFLVMDGAEGRPDICEAALFTDEPTEVTAVMPIAYRFSVTGENIPLGFADAELNDRIAARFGDDMLWTSAYLDAVKPDIRSALTSMIKPVWGPGLGQGVYEHIKQHPTMWDKALDAMAREQGGDARWLFTLLGMINVCETHVSDPVVPKERTFLHNRKVIPHTSFQTLDIVIGPGKDRVRYVESRLNALAAHRRRHQVRGHFRHRNGKETWVKPHLRGDEKLGWVVKTYNVTTPEDKQAEYDNAPT